MRSKLTEHRGFSLSELLVTVVIVSLLSIMIATGVRASLNSYKKVTDEANAEVLLSTCASMLRNELSTAVEITAEDNCIVFRQSGSGCKVSLRSISMDGAGGPVQICLGSVGVNPETGSESITSERPFISQVTGTEGLFVSFDEISYTDECVTIKGLAVRKKDSDRKLSELPVLVINNM